MMAFVRLVLLFAGLVCSWACDPNFCVNRVHEETYCDPADNTSFYVCDNGVAKHTTCQHGLVYKINYCAWPHEGACVTNPVPDTSQGTVQNGVCQHSVSTGSSTTTLQNTENTVRWDLYRKHPGKKSSCPVLQTLTTASAVHCASVCSQTSGCSDFNLSILGGRSECQLLTCQHDFLLGSSPDHDFYQEI